MTTAPQNAEANTTPAPSGNEGTTPPEAVNTGTTPPTEGGNAAQPDIDKIVQKRLDRERKNWEAEADERAKRAAMDEGERLKAELADRDKQIAERDATLKRERAYRDMADKVIDAEDAYAIAERLGLIDDDGKVDTTALLETKPYLAKTTRPVAPGPDGTPAGASARQTTAASLQERLKNARTREERVSLQRQLQQAQKG